MVKKVKVRLDQLVLQKFPELSRTLIQSLIMQGKVHVDGVPCVKAGTFVDQEAPLQLMHHEQKYVSRAGYKLEKALDHFAINVEGYVALDAGLSTGGFTDCLLQRGVKKVFGVDVGYGQVHEKIRQDPRVVVMERTNLRHVESLPELVDIVTLDLSFISVLKVIEVVAKMIKPNGSLIVLIKPQFEVEKGQVGKHGIITDPALHTHVVQKLLHGIIACGFESKGVIESPILGTEGNKEFLGYFVKNS